MTISLRVSTFIGRPVAYVRGSVPVIVGLLLMTGLAPAQTTTGTVSGAVLDSSGSRIPGASVTLTNSQTRDTRTATTSASGDYM